MLSVFCSQLIPALPFGYSFIPVSPVPASCSLPTSKLDFPKGCSSVRLEKLLIALFHLKLYPPFRSHHRKVDCTSVTLSAYSSTWWMVVYFFSWLNILLLCLQFNHFIYSCFTFFSLSSLSKHKPIVELKRLWHYEGLVSSEATKGCFKLSHFTGGKKIQSFLKPS